MAILDADREGFLRSARSLIQTAGRAARNVNGKVLMYADRLTDSMRRAIDETDRRRAKQFAYNEEHGITPRTIHKSRAEIMQQTMAAGERQDAPPVPDKRPWEGVLKGDHSPKAMVEMLESEMHQAARDQQFETAAQIRDRIEDLKAQWGIGSQDRKERS